VVRTTPPRPIDVTALFPELAPLARTAVRLHPRRGQPTGSDSSIGGPLLWPAAEPWPTCSGHDEPWNMPAAPADVRRERRGESRPVYPRPAVHRSDPGAPDPMVPLAQLYARDVPDLPRPAGTDLLQVLWCTFIHDDTDYLPRVAVRWRAAADVTDPLVRQPEPEVIGDPDLLPEPCVVHPEVVTDYPQLSELPAGLRARIEAWQAPGYAYQADLSVVPGTKVGGWAPWSDIDARPVTCAACGAEQRPLLAITGLEWEADGLSWRPVEDGDDTDRNPTALQVGDCVTAQLYACTASFDHPPVQRMV